MRTLSPLILVTQVSPEGMSSAELIAAAARIGMTAEIAEGEASGIFAAYERALRRGTVPTPFSTDWLRKERARLMRSSPLPFRVALASRIIRLGLLPILPSSVDDEWTEGDDIAPAGRSTAEEI